MLLDTADGKKRADTIELGDRLWSRNENDPHGRCELKEVEAVFVREAPVWNVHVAGQLIRTTAEHPFWVSGRGWIAACGLRIGDLVSTRDGQLVPVDGVADSGAVETVYNWRVADFHTYFVGDSSWGFSVWAHNACHVDATPESRTVGKQFRGRAEELWNTLPNGRRFGATVAVTEVNGQQVVSLYANVGRGQRQFSQAQINSFGATVEDAGGVFIHTSGNVHAEQALHQAYGSAPAIGISNYNGPCPACGRYFQQQGYFNLFWPDR